jgi:hypothetical protein
MIIMDKVEKIFDTEILKAFVDYDYCCSVSEETRPLDLNSSYKNPYKICKLKDYVLTHKSHNTSAEYRYSLMTNYISENAWWFSYLYLPSSMVKVRITGPLYTDFNHEKTILLEDNYENEIHDLLSYLKNFIL